ncbi:hypothetical protein ACL02S_22965 [Nocardia sp. 004]|uniref:hypothetical protein n=1 Tax=Nocardia sp. 004 TaxID=3385978 RepID=UPI0039A31B61
MGNTGREYGESVMCPGLPEESDTRESAQKACGSIGARRRPASAYAAVLTVADPLDVDAAAVSTSSISTDLA